MVVPGCVFRWDCAVSCVLSPCRSLILRYFTFFSKYWVIQWFECFVVDVLLGGYELMGGFVDYALYVDVAMSAFRYVLMVSLICAFRYVLMVSLV